MYAANLMATNVVTVRLDTSVSQIASVLMEHQISAVPVVDEMLRMVGIVSEGDLLRREEIGTNRRRRWLEFFKNDAQLADEYVRAHGRTAADVMSSPVATATADTPLAEIVTLMEKHHVRRVPIVAKDGKLVGLVTRSNLVRALALAPQIEPTTGLADSKVRDLMLSELHRQPWGHGRDSDIIVTEGVVHIWGTVGSNEESRALVTAAKATPGVKDVRDHTVSPHAFPYVFAA